MPTKSVQRQSSERSRPTHRRCISTGMGVLAVCLVAIVSAFLLIDSGVAGVYKYKDENGVWHFTDTPDETVYESAEQYIKDKKASTGKDSLASTRVLTGEDLQAHLQKNLPPANKIEEARNATVSIKMALGSGSGFFISESGYIVTNRHVIDSSYGQSEDTADQIENVKKQVEYQARLLDEAERQLRKEKAQLRQQRKSLHKGRENRNWEDELDYNNKTRQQQKNYQRWEDDINRREEALRQRRYQFEEQRRQFDAAYDQYEQRMISDLAQSGYTIVLADKTELQAEKVTISEKYDLALLQLKGYKTPYIPRGNAHGLHHGQPLYAIGNSLDMGHTVTSGIFSGRRADLLQTNAQINPGNSGGPLITEDGRVIGINTSKVVHSSVEGVGFAIPIHVVMTEFGAYIGM